MLWLLANCDKRNQSIQASLRVGDKLKTAPIIFLIRCLMKYKTPVTEEKTDFKSRIEPQNVETNEYID